MPRTSLRLALAAPALLAVLAGASTASAAPLNDRSCRSPGKFPVVVVHGQGGAVEGMAPITNALIGAGYCVFGKSYGQETPGGLYGRAHLDVSGADMKVFVDGVRRDTGAAKVNMVGHSAGMGVIANVIFAQGGAPFVHRAVSFGGLQHPYAHVGLVKVIDANLFLPNTVKAVQDLVPPFTSNIKFKDIAAAALGLASVAGANLPPNERALVESGFVSDLFDPQYWTRLHGGLSEPQGDFVAIDQSTRSLKTKDAAPNVCYTNIVAPADLLVGGSAGFQDEATNVDNFVLPSVADHVQMVGDPLALAKMVASLRASCTQPAGGGTAVSLAAEADVAAAPGAAGGAGVAAGPEGTDDGTSDDDDADGLDGVRRRPFDSATAGGCSSAAGDVGTASTAVVIGTVLLGLARLGRRRRAA